LGCLPSDSARLAQNSASGRSSSACKVNCAFASYWELHWYFDMADVCKPNATSPGAGLEIEASPGVQAFPQTSTGPQPNLSREHAPYQARLMRYHVYKADVLRRSVMLRSACSSHNVAVVAHRTSCNTLLNSKKPLFNVYTWWVGPEAASSPLVSASVVVPSPRVELQRVPQHLAQPLPTCSSKTTRCWHHIISQCFHSLTGSSRLTAETRTLFVHKIHSNHAKRLCRTQ